eukprot:2938314-Rhodomonas_salina.3
MLPAGQWRLPYIFCDLVARYAMSVPHIAAQTVAGQRRKRLRVGEIKDIQPHREYKLYQKCVRLRLISRRAGKCDL